MDDLCESELREPQVIKYECKFCIKLVKFCKV